MEEVQRLVENCLRKEALKRNKKAYEREHGKIHPPISLYVVYYQDKLVGQFNEKDDLKSFLRNVNYNEKVHFYRVNVRGYSGSVLVYEKEKEYQGGINSL